MTPFLDLTRAFQTQRYNIVFENQVFTIKNSSHLVVRIAENIISSAKYCPILSQNRMDSNIEFTIIPYKIPLRFERTDIKLVEIADEKLWNLIESTKTHIDDGKPIMLFGRSHTLLEARKKLVMASNCISSLMVEFCDRPLRKGTVLDLGSGRGVNSIPLLEKGWHVVAIDQSLDVLELYRQSVLKMGGKYLENGQLKLINGDITNYEFQKNAFDLVICVDVLTYVAPKKVKNLILKINESIVLNGQFIGTLFFSESDAPTGFEELFRKLGGHFYPGADLIPALLKKNGFHIEKCSIRCESETEPHCAEFVVTKK